MFKFCQDSSTDTIEKNLVQVLKCLMLKVLKKLRRLLEFLGWLKQFQENQILLINLIQNEQCLCKAHLMGLVLFIFFHFLQKTLL